MLSSVPPPKQIKRIMLVGELEERIAFVEEAEKLIKPTQIKVDFPVNKLIINLKMLSCTYVLIHFYGYESSLIEQKLTTDINNFWKHISEKDDYKSSINKIDLLVFFPKTSFETRKYFLEFRDPEKTIAIDYDNKTMTAIDCLGRIDLLTTLGKNFRKENEKAKKFRLVLCAFLYDKECAFQYLLSELIVKLMWPSRAIEYMDMQHVFFKLPNHSNLSDHDTRPNKKLKISG